jgi:hypothetical protein
MYLKNRDFSTNNNIISGEMCVKPTISPKIISEQNKKRATTQRS